MPGDLMETIESTLERRIQDLEFRVQSQAREIRALEKIEGLLDHSRELETENRDLREKVEELRTFWTLSKTLSTTLNMEELLRLTLHLIGRSLQVDAYSLLLMDEASNRLTVKGGFGLLSERAQDLSLSLGEGISGWVAKTGEPMLVPDVSAEARFAEQSCFPRQGAFLCVPLRIDKGRVIGVLNAHKPEPQTFTRADLDQFQAVANQVALALENARLYQRTKDLVSRDVLTGLFNRRYFFEHLETEIQRARRYSRMFTILMLDLDHFKQYNDTHGHLRGDEVLRGVGVLLLGNTRRADVVARFGGEEFVVLLPEITKQAGALAAEKVRAALAQYPFVGREQQPGGQLTVTIGLAAYPVDSDNGVELVDIADRALYVGKQQGGNCVIVTPDRAAALPPAARPQSSSPPSQTAWT
jgi:diguanylate cyclase (GGDEF)-like protein